MKVQKLMTAPAVSVKEDASLTDIIHIINSHQINHVPVIDSDERVIGIIGADEIFPKTRILRSPDVCIPVLFKHIVDYKDALHSYKQFTHVTAKDIMSPYPECADVNSELDQILKIMVEKRLLAIPVLREGRLAGVFTRNDFIRLIAQEL